jgi:hypothetical protein
MSLRASLAVELGTFPSQMRPVQCPNRQVFEWVPSVSMVSINVWPRDGDSDHYRKWHLLKEQKGNTIEQTCQ